MGGIFSNVQESWSKLNRVAGELATVFFVTFFYLGPVHMEWAIPPEWATSLRWDFSQLSFI